MENLNLLIKRLVSLDNEVSWVEFKHNNYDPEMIGENISALANAAAYHNRDKAYMLWGIDDKTHEIVGTKYDQYSLKVQQQEIESWLRNLLSKNCEIEFNSTTIDDKKVTILTIGRAIHQTVTFKKVNYIKVGSYTKKLMDYPSMEAQLWDKIRMNKFEGLQALKDLSCSDALAKIDYVKYFDLTKMPVPSNQEGIVHYLIEERILSLQDNGLYAITNQGAILFAKRLSDFKGLERKAVRIVQYEGNNKRKILKEITSDKGYAIELENLLELLVALLPAYEEIKGAVRTTKSLFPIEVLREMIANALIHQDFSVFGTGPLIEVFNSKVEVSNAGIPLIDISRIVDNPPRSRNEMLASLMRKLKLCEELGSGWDRMVLACEMEQISAPVITLYEDNTKVTLYAERNFKNLDQKEKIWSLYLHSCIKYIEGESMTNASFRERFGLEAKSSATVSRLLKSALEENLVKQIDPETAPKHMKYVPFWV